MNFAAIESRLNAAVLEHVCDSVTLNGVAVRGEFIDNPAVTLGMLCDKPIFDLPAADAGAAPRGKTLVFKGVSYTVSLAHKEDANGWRKLELEKL